MRLIPRNDFVLLRVVTRDKSEGGVVLPSVSKEGKDIIVEAIGPKVENLRVGDVVMVVGSSEAGDGSLVPRHKDLIITREANVVIVFDELIGDVYTSVIP